MSETVQYAGFWKRFVAGVVDALILTVVVVSARMLLPGGYLLSEAFEVAVGLTYTIVLHSLYGKTLGKRAIGIQLRTVDLRPVTAKEALARSSVDMLIAVAGFVGSMIAVGRAGPALMQVLNVSRIELYSVGSMNEHKAAIQALNELDPTHGVLSTVALVWMWSEVVTVLFNRKKRAIHDFIAGTVVVVEKSLPTAASEEASV